MQYQARSPKSGVAGRILRVTTFAYMHSRRPGDRSSHIGLSISWDRTRVAWTASNLHFPCKRKLYRLKSSLAVQSYLCEQLKRKHSKYFDLLICSLLQPWIRYLATMSFTSSRSGVCSSPSIALPACQSSSSVMTKVGIIWLPACSD